jgi:hypothetical protein
MSMIMYYIYREKIITVARFLLQVYVHSVFFSDMYCYMMTFIRLHKFVSIMYFYADKYQINKHFIV